MSFDHATSMSPEPEEVEPFLRWISASVAAIDEVDIERILEGLDAMDVDDEREWTIQARIQGAPVPIRIVVHMDDVDEPDLSFYSSEPVILALDAEIARLASPDV